MSVRVWSSWGGEDEENSREPGVGFWAWEQREATAPTFGILRRSSRWMKPGRLGLHEDFQEPAEALGGDGTAEGLSLQLQGPLLALARRQRQ